MTETKYQKLKTNTLNTYKTNKDDTKSLKMYIQNAKKGMLWCLQTDHAHGNYRTTQHTE